MTKNRLIVTLGDSGGIGPEVALKALLERDQEPDAAQQPGVVLCGPKAHWLAHAEGLVQCQPGLKEAIKSLLEQVKWLDIETPLQAPIIGAVEAEHGRIAYESIALAVREIQAGNAQSLVTAPLSKEALHKAGIHVPGQTEILRDLTGVKQTSMAFHCPGLIVALATVHIALRDVCTTLSEALILERLAHLAQFCRALGIPAPRIAVCGVNPHASEGGLFGDEEEKIIEPAMRRFSQNSSEPGVQLFGPLPGDTAFFEARAGLYDAVLAMFHDQGLAAVKTVAFDSAVNVTLGMPFFRTSPDHGTAFALAGKGVARHESMLCALRLAQRLLVSS